MSEVKVQQFTVSGPEEDIQWVGEAITAMQGCNEPQSFAKWAANLVEEIKSGMYDPDELTERMRSDQTLLWLKEKWPGK